MTNCAAVPLPAGSRSRCPGRPSSPDVEGRQIRRLATEFGCQSLHVRDVATLDEKSERHFPTFKPLREAMQEEVTRFYIDLFQNDRSSLLAAGCGLHVPQQAAG